MNKKALFITLGFVAIIVLAIAGLVVFVINNTDKLECKSSQGNITLRYKGDDIVGYAAHNISYDLDGQKEVAKRIGMDSYIKQFTIWFENNTDGTCK